jgi:hypothetical protein
VASDDNSTVSWRRSRSDSIVRVELWYQGRSVSLEGAGPYWQSDDFEVLLLGSKSRMIRRRVQRLLTTSPERWLTLEWDLGTDSCREYVSTHKI